MLLVSLDSSLPLRFPLTFIYYLQSVLCPVSCLTNVASVSGFFIASSVSSNVYLLPTVCPVSCLTNVASVSGFFIASSVSSNVYLLPTVCPVSCLVWQMLLVSLDSSLPLRFPLTFIYYLQSVLCPVSCLTNVASVSGFFIASSVSSNVYLLPTVCPVSCVLFDKCC